MKLLLVTAWYYYPAAAGVSIWLLLLLSLSLPTLCHGAGGVRSVADATNVRDLQGNFPEGRPGGGLPGGSPPVLLGRLALINAITDTKIIDLMNDTIIDLSSIAGLTRPAFNINATFYSNNSNNNTTTTMTTTSSIKFVQYGYNTTMNHRIENTAPYAFCGNLRTDFFECPILGYGTHTVSVIPWGGRNNNIPLGPIYTVTFTIVPRITLAPAPTISPYPSQAPSGRYVSPAPTFSPGLARLINMTSLTVNVTSQSSAVEFFVAIQDYAMPRISNGYMQLRTSYGLPFSTVSFAVQQATTDRGLNFTLRLPIPRFILPGIYPLYLQLYDGNSDWLYYTTNTLKSLMFPFEVNVVNAMVDVTPPKLLNFIALNNTPGPINVTKGPAAARFRFTVSDDMSGFKSLQLALFPVSGGGSGYSYEYWNNQQQSNNTGVLSPISFNFSYPFAFNYPTSSYNLRVQIYDNSNNMIEYDAVALVSLGFPSSLDVVNANVPDYTAPYLISVKALSSTTVDVSTGPRTVDIQVTVQDDISGFQYGEVWLLDPTTNINISSTAFAPASARAGVPLTFNVTVRIPRYVPAQAYIFRFFLRDAMTNTAFATDGVDGRKYFPIQVINTVLDVTPPELLNFTVSPRTVDPVSGKSNITFTIVARDDLSGIRRDQSCFLTIQSVGESFFQSTLFFPPLDSPAALGTQIIALTATFDETFDWSNEIYSLDLRFADAALNSVRFTPRALVQRGFPGLLPTYA